MDLIFLGNSYTFQNNLNTVVETIFEQSEAIDASTVRLSDGGLMWVDHVERTQSNDLWKDALVTGTASYDWGILQEQSQVPGFYGEDAIWEESAAAGATLHGMLSAKEAQTILLLTWGRRDGDSTNASLYPDFSTMQSELTEGYLAYQAQFQTSEHPVWVAPAGLAFAAVHDALAEPLATDSLFFRLYVEDGSHPSELGTWLVACTIYSTISGKSAEGLTPPFAMDATEADQLAGVAYGVVSTGVGGLHYPWETPADSDPADSDPADSDPADSDPPESKPGSSDSTQSPKEKASACGCQQGPGTPAMLIVGLLTLLRRRAQ